ncbi:MAG: hypothetical protein A2252_02760 [Elusimicrobia bacterium RIFOXYA2_FULL_39_19]|nr:MAG: hypothetical protein A2252_02760 [Elusimicrobia bacterium RIFOXYA2_FULL_39_19]
MNKNEKINYSEVRVLEASAGSGKTYALAKRYIQLLMDPSVKADDVPIKSILAITFTNKATFEMKERIIDLLKKIALDNFSNPEQEQDIYASLSITKKEAQEKAYHIIDDFIIKNYDYFQVQTIDSFVNSLISASSFKLGLSAGFEVEPDYRDLLKYSLDLLVDRAGSNKKVKELFEEFLLQYLYIEQKTGWFPKKDILETLQNLFSLGNKYGSTFEKSKISFEDAVPLKKEFYKTIKKLIPLMLDKEADLTFKKGLVKFTENNTELFGLSDITSKSFEKETLKYKKGFSPAPETQVLWEQALSNLKQIAEIEAFSLFNCYLDIYSLVLENLKTAAENKDVVFLEELNKKAKTLFDKEYITVPEIYFRLALRFKHLLIDEFQDTSRLQWMNLNPMAEEILSNGGSLFYVGDKKQAIYRFRGGDVSLFNELQAKFSAFNINKSILSMNYRSSKEIVEFNNGIFSKSNIDRFIKDIAGQEDKAPEVFFELGGIEEIAGIFELSAQTYLTGSENGFVKVELFEPKDSAAREEEIKEKVLAVLKGLTGRISYGDVAVLVRRNEDVEFFTALLIEQGIPVESEKSLNIKENFLVKELVSFLKFLQAPADNLFFASFLLGDIFSKCSGLGKETLRDFIFQTTRKHGKNVYYLYKEFKDAYPREWEKYIEEFFKNAGLIPLYEMSISLTGRFKVLQSFPQYQGFVMKFLELVKEYEKESTEMPEFLEYFDSLTTEKDVYVKVSNTDSVKVLTVHKAKGLQFGAVIVPYLTIQVDVDDKTVNAQKNSLALLNITATHAKFSKVLKQIYINEYKKAFIDELNNAYVALTRAKYELYVFVPAKFSNKTNRAKYLFPEPKVETGKKSVYLKTGAKTGPVQAEKLGLSVYTDWIETLKNEFSEKSSLINRINIRRGEVLHGILSFIGSVNEKNKAQTVKKAVEKIKSIYPEVQSYAEFEKNVLDLIEKEDFKEYFYVKTGTVFNEKEIIDSKGATKRIDRLIVYEKEAVIIDYKSSESEETAENYKIQMAEYINLVKEIYPNKEIKGFIVYLDTLTYEKQ